MKIHLNFKNMKEVILNTIKEMQFEVNQTHSAKVYGSGYVNVLSTPALVGFLEKTCNDLLLDFLDEYEVSVGIEICIKHLKPTKIGDTIKCIAKITEVNKNKITFYIEAYDSFNKISEGYHKRAIVEKEKFPV